MRKITLHKDKKKRKLGKKGASDWTMSKVVSLILLLIVAILIIAGVISGELIPLFEKVGGWINYVYISIAGFGETGAGNGGRNCVSDSASFNINGKTEIVTHETCLEFGVKSCNLGMFSVGPSNYTYYPETDVLTAVRGDSGTNAPYVVDFTERNENDDIYYEGVRYLYEVYGGGDEGKVQSYDIESYIALGMDHHFGEFSDLLIIAAEDKNVFFMESSGRYLVLDWGEYRRKSGGLGLFGTITPILAGVSSTLAGELYSGDDLDLAIKAFRDKVDHKVYGYDEHNIDQYLCKPVAVGSVHDNCYYLDNAHDESSLESLLSWIYKYYKPLDRSLKEDTTGNNKFNTDRKEKLLRVYLEDRRKAAIDEGLIGASPESKGKDPIVSESIYFLIGKSQDELDDIVISSGRPVIVDGGAPRDAGLDPKRTDYVIDEINKKLGDHSSEGIATVSGKTFRVYASGDSGSVLPIIIFVNTEDPNEEYWFQFNGNELYQEGNSDAFSPQGNQVRAPFKLLKYNPSTDTGKVVEVSRTYSASDEEQNIDKIVIDYLRNQCL